MLFKIISGFIIEKLSRIFAMIDDFYAVSAILISITIAIFLFITDKRRVIRQIANAVVEDPRKYRRKFKSYTIQNLIDLTTTPGESINSKILVNRLKKMILRIRYCG